VTRRLPNVLSVLELALGFASLMFTLKSDWTASLRCLLLAGLVDGLAGLQARSTGRDSAFGGELDDLASLASLGVCPAIFSLRASLGSLGPLGWYTAALAVCFSAVRLARNAAFRGGEHRGLPVPAAGLILALAAGLGAPGQALVLLIFALVFFMLIPWPYARTSAHPPFAVGMVLVLLAPVFWPSKTLMGTCGALLAAYALVGHAGIIRKIFRSGITV
jgi:CDP-diacylglycerol--serine O-phosphatidyltransferase